MGNPAAAVHYETESGSSHPLGATPDDDGVNFAVFSEHANAVELLLFDEHDDRRADPGHHASTRRSTGRSTSGTCYVRGLQAGLHYAYRVDGPQDPHAGAPLRPEQGADRPVRPGHHRRACGIAAPPAARATTWRPSMRSVVIDTRRLRLGGRPAAEPPDAARRSSTRCTSAASRKSPTSGRRSTRHVRRRHREDPVPEGARRHRRRAAAGLRVRRRATCCARSTARRSRNYWGYSTVGFFAPHAGVLRPRRSASTSASSATWSRRCTRPASR